MPSITPRQHSQYARRLIKACGGLEEAATACRLSTSSLGNAQSPNHDYYLPADVISDLEAYCGEPIYSAAMADQLGRQSGTGDLMGGAIDMNALAANLSANIHHAISDGVVSGHERDTLMTAILDIRHSLDRIESDLRSPAPVSHTGVFYPEPKGTYADLG